MPAARRPRMAWDLQELDCESVMFASRERHNDRKDQATIGHAQRAGKASSGLRFDFARPNDQCLLWLPDAVAGAVSAAFADGQVGGVEQLGECLQVLVL